MSSEQGWKPEDAKVHNFSLQLVLVALVIHSGGSSLLGLNLPQAQSVEGVSVG